MGKFEFYENGEKIGEAYPNRILYCGIAYSQDTVFGIESWQSGVAGYDGSLPASGAWDPYRTIVIGVCADDNNGWLNDNSWLANGGSGIEADSVPIGGNSFAHFPALTDTYMTSAASGGNANRNVGTGLFYKTADRTVRVGNTAVAIEATFNSTADPGSINANTLLVGTEIREMGISLADIPTGFWDPLSDRTHRPNTLINRSVRILVSGGYVQDAPLTMGSNPITVRYTFGENI